ncbi:GFP-like fluorescent chromoprotein amFP486 [Acropora cervicornis]|uniref:GFP-like fluorescent chromoprotein amFP486 n=1 Tax=Acropora cervicornis TaxID=6130 RepID=A0AAD9QKQ8_ACRCE|nr:GFP-like fluorescent chromoprotein amFP486 [Acropora cervicornis]
MPDRQTIIMVNSISGNFKFKTSMATRFIYLLFKGTKEENTRGTQMSELVIIKPSFNMETGASQSILKACLYDYFKQAFPDGMSYERSFLFEDGGVATASWNIRYCNFFQLWHSENILKIH